MALPWCFHDSAAWGPTTHWHLHSVSLCANPKERDWLSFFWWELFIFINQAVFKGRQYAHRWSHLWAKRPNPVISSRRGESWGWLLSPQLTLCRMHLESHLGPFAFQVLIAQVATWENQQERLFIGHQIIIFKQCFDRLSTKESETYGLNFHWNTHLGLKIKGVCAWEGILPTFFFCQARLFGK